MSREAVKKALKILRNKKTGKIKKLKKKRKPNMKGPIA